MERRDLGNHSRNNPEPAGAAYQEEYWKSILKVDQVDLCLNENGQEHHTSKYDLMQPEYEKARLVIRRGQEFSVDLILESTDYDSEEDKVFFIFSMYGNNGSSIITRVRLRNREETSEHPWKATIDTFEKNSLRVRILTPADAAIGKWMMRVLTTKEDATIMNNFVIDEPIYMIFNPWCQDDLVHLENEAERQEYVMEGYGRIWRNALQPIPWIYSQFEKDILECAFYHITNISEVPLLERRNPITICRALSAAVNSADDDGTLVGRWAGTYPGGTAPTKWWNSRDILLQYYKTKESVRYGQCWVFAGVLTTICRTLGIPCRPVTNYISGRDTDGSLTIDFYYDMDLNKVKDFPDEWIWNFHVWNEVWMRRIDLSPEYDGWQVIDATPQKKSGKVYRCGPTSVVAVKRGETSQNYDTDFVFAEVNGDVAYWLYRGPDQRIKMVKNCTDDVGEHICTKAVGSQKSVNITNTYKHEEHTVQERIIMEKAMRESNFDYSRYCFNDEFDDVKFQLDLENKINLGQPFSVVLEMKNENASEEFLISVKINVQIYQCDTKIINMIKKLNTDISIQPGAVEKVLLDIYFEDYEFALSGQCDIEVLCLAAVEGIDYHHFDEQIIAVIKPSIVIKRTTDAVVGKVLRVTASFDNPLSVNLRNGEFYFKALGYEKTIKMITDIAPFDEASCHFKMIPKYEGHGMIIVKFHSEELTDVHGSDSFVVKQE